MSDATGSAPGETSTAAPPVTYTTPPFYMPLPDDPRAPRFTNPDDELSLTRFFDSLDELFTRAKIIEDEVKKRWAIRYASGRIAEYWYSLPGLDAMTYPQFKAALEERYPNAIANRKYRMGDMDRLVAEFQKRIISSMSDYTDFYSRFQVIANHLCEKKYATTRDCSNAFQKALSTSPYWPAIKERLHIKLIDHDPGLPFKLKDLDDHTSFVIQGATVVGANSHEAASPSASTSVGVKVEEIKPLVVTLMKEMFTPVLSELQQQTTAAISAIAAVSTAASGNASMSGMPRRNNNGRCHYCGEVGHTIAECLHVEDDAKAGMVRRNAQGQVVLPGGGFPPRALSKPDATIGERVRIWHEQHPGQRATGTLSSNINTMLFEVSAPSSPEPLAPHQVFMLSDEDRCESIERELMQLRARKQVFDGVELVRRRPGQPVEKQLAPVPVPDPPTITRDLVPDEPSFPPPTPTSPPPANRPVIVSEPAAPAPPAVSSATTGGATHPYANARDATYLPPRDRNFGAPGRPYRANGNPGYVHRAPVQDPKIVDSVFARSMSAPLVTLSCQEILSLAPDIRTKVREMVTPRRVDQPHAANIQELESLPFAEDPIETTASAFAQITEEIETPTRVRGYLPAPEIMLSEGTPAGVYVVSDPFEQYLHHHHPEDDSHNVIVAAESHALRSIMATIDNKYKVECIVDPGSQIISMSAEVAKALSLSWDPMIRLNMQSANRSISRSLGLAHNVPFQIGGVTLYFQVHVIPDAAYDVLLGRPFDVLTQSRVKNFDNEDQTITIVDPNTGRATTIPTQIRGKRISPGEAFQASRI